MNTWSPEINLAIPYDDFEANVKKPIPVIKKTPNGKDYVPWGIAYDMLREYSHGVLDVGFEESEPGNPLWQNSTGYYLRAYLYDMSHGKRTPVLIFPCRVDRTKGETQESWTSKHHAINITDVGNDIQRAAVKCIARFTGLCWSLYARYDESIPMGVQDDDLVPPRSNNNTRQATSNGNGGNKRPWPQTSTANNIDW